MKPGADINGWLNCLDAQKTPGRPPVCSKDDEGLKFRFEGSVDCKQLIVSLARIYMRLRNENAANIGPNIGQQGQDSMNASKSCVEVHVYLMPHIAPSSLGLFCFCCAPALSSPAPFQVGVIFAWLSSSSVSHR